MLLGLQEVTEEFMKLFYGAALADTHVSVPEKSGTGATLFMLNFVRKGSPLPNETPLETYPMMSLEVMPIVLPQMRNNNVQKTYGGRRDTDNDNIPDTIDEIPMPVWLEIPFEISVATRNIKQLDDAKDWFLENFDVSNTAVFEFKKVELPNGLPPIADYVPYTLEMLGSPRLDNIHEEIFRFTLKPNVLFKKEKALPLTRLVTATINQVVNNLPQPTPNNLGVTVITNG